MTVRDTGHTTACVKPGEVQITVHVWFRGHARSRPNPTEFEVGNRPVGAILADLHDEWQATDRRYHSEDTFEPALPDRDSLATAELTAGNPHCRMGANNRPVVVDSPILTIRRGVRRGCRRCSRAGRCIRCLEGTTDLVRWR